MSVTAKGLTMMPKGILFGLIKTKLSGKAGFTVLMATINIDYRKDSFKLELRNDELKRLSKSKNAVSEFSDISEVLMEKVVKKISAKQIDVIKLVIDIKNKSTKADVYYISNEGEPCHQNLTHVF